TPSRTYRRCRGTAILIKNTIRHQHLPNPTLRYIEATMVIVNLPNTPPLISFQLIGPLNKQKLTSRWTLSRFTPTTRPSSLPGI
ncbi:hypothetical protein AVEN_52334-1, partial [Araneus ventricosus]